MANKEISQDYFKVIDYLSDNPRANNLEISKGTDMNLGRVQAVLCLLVQAGIIKEV